ncbi:TPA: phosphoribulokinase, partial [Streptococcus pneumoniae]|nr:phosphoribulokinase [Streptococcus pneumoniae]
MKKKDLVDQLVSEIETGKVRTLGIYGHGASGKSTFAKVLLITPTIVLMA